MIFPVHHIFFKIVAEQSKNPKFKQFVQSKDFIIHDYSEDPVADMRSRLTDAGFEIQNLELRKLNFTFPSIKHLESK